MKKTLALASLALAGSLGFGSAAFAQAESHMLPPHERARMEAIQKHYERQERVHNESRERMREWQSYNHMYRQRIPNWRSHGLYAPPPGHGWYRGDDNRYALVDLANGVIAGMVTR